MSPKKSPEQPSPHSPRATPAATATPTRTSANRDVRATPKTGFNRDFEFTGPCAQTFGSSVHSKRKAEFEFAAPNTSTARSPRTPGASFAAPKPPAKQTPKELTLRPQLSMNSLKEPRVVSTPKTGAIRSAFADTYPAAATARKRRKNLSPSASTEAHLPADEPELGEFEDIAALVENAMAQGTETAGESAKAAHTDKTVLFVVLTP